MVRPSTPLGFPLQCVTVPTTASESSAEVLDGYHRYDQRNPEIRANLPKYANWPTFPQLWVAGELVGGSDIMLEMFEKGELQTLIKEAAAKAKASEA